ncbi:MAG: hypothetical protein U0T69_14640 [Chitinophagales bacterium]
MKVSLLPEEEQRALRKGINPSRKVFKKGSGEQLIFKKSSAEIKTSDMKNE